MLAQDVGERPGGRDSVGAQHVEPLPDPKEPKVAGVFGQVPVKYGTDGGDFAQGPGVPLVARGEGSAISRENEVARGFIPRL